MSAVSAVILFAGPAIAGPKRPAFSGQPLSGLSRNGGGATEALRQRGLLPFRPIVTEEERASVFQRMGQVALLAALLTPNGGGVVARCDGHRCGLPAI